MRGRGRPRHPDVLTPRQWEVLGLVQEGLTNEEIADRLGITERGAKFHVSEILGKLGIANRYEAASWQPAEPAAARARRPWALALAPFGALRRLHWSAAAQVAAVAGTIVVVAGIAALAWGLVRTYDSSGRSGSPAEALGTASSSLVVGSPAALSSPGGTASPTAGAVELTPKSSVTGGSGGCPALYAIPPDPRGTALVDVDGDGRPEPVAVLSGSSTVPLEPPELVVQFPGNVGATANLPPASLDRSAVIGGYDVNGDGREEIFVNDGEGAHSVWIDVYEFDPATCQLVRLAAPDARGNANPPQFAWSSSVQNGADLRCEDGKLVSIDYSNTPPTSDPPVYIETRTTYALDGLALRVVSVEKNLPLEPLAGGLNCGALKLPPF